MVHILIEMRTHISQKLLIVVFIGLVEACLVNGGEIKGFDDTVLYKINWPGLSGSDLLEAPDVEPMLITTRNNEKFRCLLPQFRENEKDTVEKYHGPNPLELLAPLFTQSSCSYRLESYWTYELCHGRYVRQYHEDREGKKVKLQEYFLGKWDKSQYTVLSEELDRLDQEKEALDIPAKKIDGLNMPFLQVNMTDGTMCDLSDKPRMTRVLYVCYSHGKHEIYSLKESSTCEYEVIVLSPFLCQHPRYRPKESGENAISCQPVEGSTKKPRDLNALEAESLKLRHQKIIDGDARVRVEIHPVEVIIDQDDAQQLALPESTTDTSLVDEFLSGRHCLNGGSGWWKYEFCYGKNVDQYHEEKDGTRTVVHLGKFNVEKHIEWMDKNPHKRPKPLQQRKHVSHFYSDGTDCDKTSRPRHVEVKLKCLENSSPSAVALYLLEPKTCEYILGVESPIICNLLDKVDDYGLFKMDSAVSELEEVTVSEDDDDDDFPGDDE